MTAVDTTIVWLAVSIAALGALSIIGAAVVLWRWGKPDTAFLARLAQLISDAVQTGMQIARAADAEAMLQRNSLLEPRQPSPPAPEYRDEANEPVSMPE